MKNAQSLHNYFIKNVSKYETYIKIIIFLIVDLRLVQKDYLIISHSMIVSSITLLLMSAIFLNFRESQLGMLPMVSY